MMLLHSARATRAGLLALLVACGTAAASAAAPSPHLAAVRGLPGGEFAADLRACQNALGGRLAQRRRADPGHPRIAACLAQRGWGPDGTPSLERLLAPR